YKEGSIDVPCSSVRPTRALHSKPAHSTAARREKARVGSQRGGHYRSPSIGTAAFAWKSGVELFGPFAEEGEVVRSATPAGPVAWTTHLGPYSGLGAAHDAVRQWCRANNRKLAGPNWEISGHWQSEWNTNPSQIRTDVYYLLTS